jgi:hypothetical protein
VLEAHALFEYVRWCVGQGHVGQRLVIVVDSGVVKSAIRKFRSSSRVLNHVLRRIASLCLCYDIYVEVLWVPTWANPGDAPSRGASIDDWQRKALPLGAFVFDTLCALPEFGDEARSIQSRVRGALAESIGPLAVLPFV